MAWLPSVAGVGSRALDVGCGTGRHAAVLAASYGRVRAIDLSSAMVDVARAQHSAPNITYEHADLFDVDGCYDCVYSSAVLHHIDDLDAALVHLRSLVAPGGRAVLVDVVRPRSALRALPIRVAPRLAHRAGAVVGLVRDVVLRRPGAWTAFRLRTFGPWLDHVATDRFLTPTDFDAAYGRQFPGAAFTQVGHLRACVWLK